MTQADNPTASAPAAGEELQIPKHRLDEAMARVRRLEEEGQIKDQLYMEDRRRFQAQSQPQNQHADPTAEEIGLDPETHQKMLKVAKAVAKNMLAQESAVVGQQIGILSARAERAELLATKGADKAAKIPEIEKRQREHYNRTGTFLPAEIALTLIESDEKDATIRALQARIAAGPSQIPAGTQSQPSAPVVNPPGSNPYTGGVPPAAATRTGPLGAPAPTAAPAGGAPASRAPYAGHNLSDIEREVLDLEARLEEGFKAELRL